MYCVCITETLHDGKECLASRGGFRNTYTVRSIRVTNSIIIDWGQARQKFILKMKRSLIRGFYKRAIHFQL